MSIKFETEGIYEAYNQVRHTDDIKWVIFGYKEDNLIGVTEKGEKFEDFVKFCQDDARFFAFCSFNTGDELSIRKKFVLISWLGEKVKGLKRAAYGIHRSEIKKLLTVAVDISAATKEDVRVPYIMEKLKAAGGANYGNSAS